MSNAIAPLAKEKLNSVRDLINGCMPQIQAALPPGMMAEQLARIAFSACQRNAALLDCTKQSLALAVINCAELGIKPNLIGEAYLVPYGKTATLIPGYKGLMKLARNSGMVTGFQVGVVREGDTFEYQRGTDKFLKHVEAGDNEDAEITHFWAGATVDGVFEFEVMTKKQVDKVRSASRAGNSGPWKDHYEEMGKKTVIRRLCKLLPADSDKLHKAVALDERADAGLPQANDLVDLGVAEEVNPNDTGAGAKAKKALGIAKTPVEAPPARPSAEFDSWFKGLNEDAQGAYTAVYEAERNNGATVDDAHAAAFDQLTEALSK